MTAERVLQILVATMSVLAATLMGIGQQSLLMPGAMFLAAVVSVVFTDALGWLVLHRVVVNVVAIGAMAITLMDFWQTDSNGQLLEIAFLLICWQIVMLFQKKSPRVYWCLAVLSLLQVVVASVLHVGVQFGILLSLYVIVGLFALAVFFVHREVLRASAGLELPLWGSAAVPGVRPLGSAPEGPVDETAALLLGGPPLVRQAISPESVRRQLLTGPFLRHVGGVCMLTLVFAIVFFYAAPRLGNSPWNGAGSQSQEVGFTREVELNEIGKIQQSNELVMRVSFQEANRDPSTGERNVYQVYGEPYFQGVTLSDYRTTSSGSTRWSQMQGFRGVPGIPLPRADRRRNDVIRQEILLEPVSERTLFSVFPVWRVRGTPEEIRQDPFSKQIFRSRATDSSFQKHQFRYVLGTSGFRNGMQTPMTPHQSPTGELDSFSRRRLLRIDRERFPVLIQTAEEVVRENEAGDNQLLKARVLQNHLLNTDIYSYTLDFTEIDDQRDASMDPIEQFMAEHRRGHCEYFASALVMMLRSQGIPARMVVGYLGGDYNTLGNYFQVRQSHAHAWVEAYLEPEEVPTGTQTSNIPPGYGAWVRLDGTPGAGNDLIEPSRNLIGRLDQMLDYAEVLWNEYVMDMSPEQQQRVIYDPLTNRAEITFGGIRGLQMLRTQVDQVAKKAVNQLQLLVQGSLSLGGLLVLGGLLLAMVGIYFGLRRLLRWLLRKLGDSALSKRIAAHSHVQFYRKLERLLGRLGLKRRPAQTQREFALQASETLAASGGTAEVAQVPLVVAELFYRVRFGGQTLDKGEAESIEHALDELDAALKARGRSTRNVHPSGSPGTAHTQ